MVGKVGNALGGGTGLGGIQTLMAVELRLTLIPSGEPKTELLRV